MRVRVLLFGQLKDIIGRREDSLELAPGAKVSEVMSHYAQKYPGFQPISASIACSVNQEYASATAVLRDGDEVGLLPPVSGGTPDTKELQMPTCAIVRETIATQEIADGIKAGSDGAVAVFEGIVRDNSRGRRTQYLDYEAYESMAFNEMQRLAQAARERFAIRDVRLVHRLGRLEIGETSVLVVVAAAHRAAAFEACRWLIDSLKKTVPIWKKEHFEDGAVWADGEPFPEEIRGRK
ncbi:MAG TPA: molybdenum cofactor biosynthesis protein MoaE [Candidatus Angelobacter sp.]|nr:molybdenum cofactor biosynthesis protein MoaE [Candidatus Angelobacter sp.]